MNRVRLPRVLGRTATGTMRCRNPGYVGRRMWAHQRVPGPFDSSVLTARDVTWQAAHRQASRHIADPLT